ncbi:MAG TPA: hypothetical protein VLO09_08640 [Ornithinimicrobium sp.]|nr:hypothetical protein [Ornithinimicrobium sp.]
MPEDLVRRIEARLAVEAHAAGRPTSRTGAADHLVDLAAERSHRRPARTVALLGVAAAGLLVTTVGLGQVVDGEIFGSRSASDSAALYPTGTDGRAEGGPAGAAEADGGAAQDEAAGAGSDDEALAGPAAGGAADAGSSTEESAASALIADDAADIGLPEELVILNTLGVVTRTDYRDRLEQAAAQGADEASRLSRPAVAGCWAATGSEHRWDSLHAADGELDGDPVVVLMGRSGDRGEAYLLPWQCTTSIPSTDEGDAATAPLEHISWPPEG